MLLANKTLPLGSSAARLAVAFSTAPARSAPAAVVATAAAPASTEEWETHTEKGCMVHKELEIEERDTGYLRATSANGLMTDGPLLTVTEESDYLSEAQQVEYMYKGPCDSTSSLQLNASTQLTLENAGSSQPMSMHYASFGGHMPTGVNLGGTGLSHLHFKGFNCGLGTKYVSACLLGAHPSRQLHASSIARQQGVQDSSVASGGGSGGLGLGVEAFALFDEEEAQKAATSTAQGIQGDADSAQARLWVSRCLGDGLYTDCDLPPESAGERGRQRRRSVQEMFVQMLTDIRSAAEAQLHGKKAK